MNLNIWGDFQIFISVPLNDVLKNGVNNKLMLRKYFLATGVLKDSLQDSVDMIVGNDGRLSYMAVCRTLDLKYQL